MQLEQEEISFKKFIRFDIEEEGNYTFSIDQQDKKFFPEGDF